ncbi:unnamed protein product [Symbiodinium microadriaticum]|nr:unnamed protein product [Symbiodinium microadriaticum]
MRPRGSGAIGITRRLRLWVMIHGRLGTRSTGTSHMRFSTSAGTRHTFQVDGVTVMAMPNLGSKTLLRRMNRGSRPRIQMPGIHGLLIKTGMTRGPRPLRIQMPGIRVLLIKPGMTRTIPLRIQIAGGSRLPRTQLCIDKSPRVMRMASRWRISRTQRTTISSMASSKPWAST